MVNGMSYSGRKAFGLTLTVNVEVTKEDFGSDDPMAGVEFQDRLERKAFDMGGGEFNAPAQRVSDFLKEETIDGLTQNVLYTRCDPK